MTTQSIIISKAGIFILDGKVAMDRVAEWAAHGEAQVFLLTTGENIAPAIGGAMDADSLGSIANAFMESDAPEVNKVAFSTTLGYIAGELGVATSIPLLGSVILGFFIGKAYEMAFQKAYDLSNQHDWGSVHDSIDAIKASLTGNPDPIAAMLRGSPTMTVNQYQIDGAEFVGTSFGDASGPLSQQYITLSGEAAAVYQMPTITVTASGTLDDPSITSGPLNIDLSQATLIHSATTTISLAGLQAGMALGNLSLGVGYGGNTVDFASDLGVAAGLPEFGVGSHSPAWDLGPLLIDPSLRGNGISSMLDLNTVAGEYAFEVAYMLGNSQETLLSQDYGMTAEAWYQTATGKLGESARQAQVHGFIVLYMDAGGSPIAIDLNGDGVKTISLAESSIKFDVTGDGVAEHSGWLSPEDAFLFRDINGNQYVDGVTELFGGLTRGEGYAELATLDSNSDHTISAADTLYSELKIWRDLDSNGVSDSGELRSLMDAGITRLDLSYVSQEDRQSGNLIGEVSSAVVNGAMAEMADVYFRFVANTEDPEIDADTLEIRSGTSTRSTGSPVPRKIEVFEEVVAESARTPLAFDHLPPLAQVELASAVVL